MDKKIENHREVIIFLENIKRLREEKGYSKNEMAKRLKIGIYSLNKMERGELPPKLSVADMFKK